MPNEVFHTTLGISVLFLVSGCLELGFSLVAQSQKQQKPDNGEDAVHHLLSGMMPLTAGTANGALTLATFAFAMLGLMAPMRSWLKTGGYLITICGLFTLCLGLYLWIMTLRLKDNFFPTYLQQTPAVQSVIQQTFQCCGYYNATTPAFVTDSTCPSPAAAALLRGCGTAISGFANAYLDTIFTTLFGIVGLDVILILSIACLLKERKERERYRHIEEKSGFRQF
ncbi:tetraspanin [Metarhizium rileyi]|uniref:Phospholipid scramblase 1 n=1 Tax=Metarhizium rileyi (strain RCEF 4871) TaxID=1649241 RepID=A0A167DPU7_METRR|nr:tetraspanin [Metarhizium rileyi RCEF 4871]TWU77070.1 phospholipid scramblase 1 [Metarhizium rileyi]